MKKRTTIKDIARELKIHHTTVSRALHDHPEIKFETKEVIKKMAARLDYHPNSIAQQLKQKSSNFIGVIVPEIKHHFFANIISGIEEVTYKEGFVILVCQSNEQYDREMMNTNALISSNAAGLLVSISQETYDLGHFEDYLKTGGKIVFFDRTANDIDVSKVVVNDYKGAFMATEHLISRGRKRIAHIAGTEIISVTQQRLKGYQAALKKNNIKFDRDLVVFSGFHEINGAKAMEKLLELDNPPDALFAVNDPVAIGAYDIIKNKGLKIPEDISIVGFSNNPVSGLVEPSLTTVEQPSFELGRRAAEILIKELRDGEINGQTKTDVLETKLVVRNSS